MTLGYGKTGYIKRERKRSNQKDKTFSAKWGERAESIAEREDVAISSIHMRVRNFGTPWQRAKTPSKSEELCGKTLHQLADELQMHPQSVMGRIIHHNNPYISERGIIREENNSNAQGGRYDLWLMPEHPCYAEWKEQKDKKNAELLAEAEAYQEELEEKRKIREQIKLEREQRRIIREQKKNK